MELCLDGPEMPRDTGPDPGRPEVHLRSGVRRTQPPYPCSIVLKPAEHPDPTFYFIFDNSINLIHLLRVDHPNCTSAMAGRLGTGGLPVGVLLAALLINSCLIVASQVCVKEAMLRATMRVRSVTNQPNRLSPRTGSMRLGIFRASYCERRRVRYGFPCMIQTISMKGIMLHAEANPVETLLPQRKRVHDSGGLSPRVLQVSGSNVLFHKCELGGPFRRSFVGLVSP